jgi:phosphomannomutase/phosphoglucomutase
MFRRPRVDLTPNTLDYELLPFIKPTGFREYDARWLYGKEVNLLGIQAVGLALGSLLHERGEGPEIITGHDFRSYSGAVKQALATGLLAAGCIVHDIGLSLSPMAYFAQFRLNVPAVAMVTASHNENGWTGLKMGLNRPFTFGPEEMSWLKQRVMEGTAKERDGGRFARVPGIMECYVADLISRGRISNELRVVVACGNGTAGAFAPDVLRGIGCEVVPLHCELDHNFPHYNPNPEDLAMLSALAEAVLIHAADIGLAFDGDGDRCGVIDDRGRIVFADKMGVLLARSLSRKHGHAKFVTDVKSTGLFNTDPVLKTHGASTEFWMTGHSHIKKRMAETGAIAGFEKSGHCFFGPPLGRGYDDGLLTGILICEMIDEAGEPLSELYDDLPLTWSSPTMSPHCGDQEKYEVVANVTSYFVDLLQRKETFAGQKIRELMQVNGIRVTLEDGSWGLVRASSNKPELVVVCESPTSKDAMRRIFVAMESVLKNFPAVGDFNQRLNADDINAVWVASNTQGKPGDL